MTTVQLVRYVLFPKTAAAVLYRLVYYAPAFVLIRASRADNLSGALDAVAAFVVIEGVFGTSRNVLNDLWDYAEDAQRGHRWLRAVTRANRRTVAGLLTVKLLLGTVVAAAIDRRLLWIGAALLITQVAYDAVTKQWAPVLGVLTVAAGYPFRAIAPLMAVDAAVPLSTTLGLMLVAYVFALHQTFEWRHHESRYLVANRLLSKPGTTFLASAAGARYMVATRLGFCCLFVATCDRWLLGTEWLIALVPGTVACATLTLVVSDRALRATRWCTNTLCAVTVAALLVDDTMLRLLVLNIVVPYAVEYHSRIIVPEISAGRFAGVPTG